MNRAPGYTDVLDILEIVDRVGEGCELTVDTGEFRLHVEKEAGAPGDRAGSSDT